MKKQIIRFSIMALFALALPFASKAQTEKVWSMGPEMGLNFSKYGNDAGSNDMKSGVLGGLFVTYSIENTWGFTTKFLYSQKGAKFNNTEQTLSYVEIPFIARYFLNREGGFRPNVFLGPSLGFLAGAKNKVGNEGSTKIENYDNVFNKFDLGVTAGVGLNFRVMNETYIIFDTRYTHGLTDITKAAGNVNNKAFAVTAGVSFGF